MAPKMLGVTLRDRKRAVWFREQTTITDILLGIKRKKNGAGQAMQGLGKIAGGRLELQNGCQGKGSAVDDGRKLGGLMK